jgi:crotonobetainyl-CoA:carnitine CoA-transferase CaiB-like acyl-CoA transferase
MVAEQVNDNGERVIPPSLNAEKAAAFYSASAVKAALFAVNQGAAGQRIDIDMEQAAWHTYFIDGFWGHCWTDPKIGKFPSISALFNVLIAKSKDGRYCFTGCLSDKEWKEWLASDIGKKHPPTPENLEKWQKGIAVRLGDMTNFTNYFKDIVIQYNFKDYEKVAEKDGLICALCTTPEETLVHPQILHNKTVSTYTHPKLGQYQLANHPMKYTATPPRPFSPAPLPNEHQPEIMREIGA